MKRRSLISNKKHNTAALDLLLPDSMIALKETGLTTLVDGLIHNGQGKEEAV